MNKPFLIIFLLLMFSTKISAYTFTDTFNYNYSVFQTRWQEHNSTTECVVVCGPSDGSRVITVGSALRLAVTSPSLAAWGVAFTYKASNFENFQASFQIKFVSESPVHASNYIQAAFVFRNKGNFTNQIAEPSDAYMLSIDNINDNVSNFVTLSKFIGGVRTVLTQRQISSYAAGTIFNFTVSMQGNAIKVWNTTDETQLIPSKQVFDLTDDSISGSGSIALRARQSNGATFGGSTSAHDFNFIRVSSDVVSSSSLSASLTAAQVIPNVDFVVNKTAYAKILLQYNASNSSVTNITINLTYDGKQVGYAYYGTLVGGNNFTIYFPFDTPEPKANALIKAEITHFAQGYEQTEILEKYVTVTKTRELKLAFIYVDRDITTTETMRTPFDLVATKEFIRKTYPIADTAIKINGGTFYNSSYVPRSELRLINLVLLDIATNVLLSTFFTGFIPESNIGVVPNGWFNQWPGLGNDTSGLQMPLFSEITDTILVDERFTTVTAHELGHTYGLCEEYDVQRWNEQNSFLFGLFGGCPNAKNSSGQFNLACFRFGCNTSTLAPLSGFQESTTLHNFMGALQNETFEADKWVATDTYEHLLKKFSHSTPEQANSRILVSGLFNRSSGKATLRNFYILGTGEAYNRSDFTSGNYSLELLDGNNSIFLNPKFDLSFEYLPTGGNSTSTNESPFVLLLAYSENVTKVQFKENNTVKLQVNKTPNKPTISLISPIGGELFSNQIFNVTWNASDLDGDNLSYAVLISADNGSTYSTLVFDYNLTFYSINSSALQDSKNYTITVLATDGFNTANTSSNSVFEIDNDMNVTKFSIVYANLTQRIFRIDVKNTLNFTIQNISWIFNSQQDNKSSLFPFNLSSMETIQIYIYQNYTNPGNYSPQITVMSGKLIERERILLEVA
ncbi:MAG: hypothetical protein AABX01_02040 [Candidatus Micrarchaeota archaeon]